MVRSPLLPQNIPNADFWANLCTRQTVDNDWAQSDWGNRNTKPEFSRIRGGGSTSEISTCSMDLEKSSTENGMLQGRGNPVSHRSR